MKKFSFLLLLAGTLSAASCKKEETVTMRTRFLMAGTWRLDRTSLNSASAGDTTLPGAGSSVNTTYRFGESTAFFATNMAVSPVIEGQIGIWKLQDADTRLVLTDTTFAGNYEITQLDDTALVIRTRFTADGADSTTMLRRRFKRAS